MRLKHRSHLECVSGLTQHALLVDVYAKVLADNLGSLVCQGTAQDADLPSTARTCNRAYAGFLLATFVATHGVGDGVQSLPSWKRRSHCSVAIRTPKCRIEISRVQNTM